MTAVDMPADDLTSVLSSALGAVDGVVSAYLFGSVAEGRTHRDSDVDLGVLLDRVSHPTKASRFETRLDLAGRLRARVRRDVDVVILNDAPPQLARRILTEGRCLLQRDRDADRAFARTTLSRAADLEPFLRRARRVKLTTLGQ
jgi:predicted nucleotidyltransferase